MALSVLSAADAVSRAQQTDLTLLANMRPTIVGPRAGLHRYTNSAEKAGVDIGAYDPLANHTYIWPGQAADSVVDLAYAALYVDNANLNYFNKYVGLSGSCQPSAIYPNRVRAASFIFADGNGAVRSTDFGDRDVAVGDTVVIRGTGTDAAVHTVTSVVTGFVGEPIAAITGTAAADANNAATQVLGASVAQTVGTPINEVVATVNDAAYDSTIDGYITRTYTVTVTQSSTGGDATTALLRVQSADGGDDANNVTPAAFGSPTAIGARGLTMTLSLTFGHGGSVYGSGISATDLVVGQQWVTTVSEAFTRPTLAAAGTYTGTQTTGYLVTVATGGKFASGPLPTVTVTTTTGYDRSGPTTVTASAAAVAIGNYGVTLAFTGTALRAGDVYHIPATAAGQGALQTLVLQDSAPTALLGQEVDLRLFVVRQGLSVPMVRSLPSVAVNWSSGPSGVTIDGGILITDAAFTTSGVLTPVPLSSGELFLHYREWLTTGVGTVISVNDPTQIAAVLGPVDPDNPLAAHVNAALANTASQLLTSPSRIAPTSSDVVLAVTIGGDPSVHALWDAALGLTDDDDEMYNLVPISADPYVLSAFATHATAQSTDASGFYRRALLTQTLPATGAEASAANSLDGNPITATIAAAPGGGPTVYTALTASANAAFVTAGVRVGDVVRINYGHDALGNETYDSYVVGAIPSQTTLTLDTGPSAAVTVGIRVEVWRTYTTADLTVQLLAAAAGYATSSVILVWPDVAGFAGEAVPGSMVAAGLAGLMGSVLPHQGLRNVGLEGVDSITRSERFFSAAQLEQLRAGGVTVVSQGRDGTVYVYGCVTTAAAAYATLEEVKNRTADYLRKAVQTVWAPYIGSGNVVSNIGDLLNGALLTLASKLKTPQYAAALGPPVANLVLGTISSVVGRSDAVTAAVTAVGLPNPLNQIQIQLPVS